MFTEKHVFILSGISGILNLITCICIALSWTYWSNTLNNCTGDNCECILFGQIRGSSFIGGSPNWCRSITYTTLILTIVSFAVSAYFLIKTRSSQPKTTFSRPISETNIAPRSFAQCRNKSEFPILFKFLAGVITLILFIYAISLSEGYGKTCSEYKLLVGKYLKASGDMLDLVTERLSCTTAYDFLDYLQPDPILRNPYLGQYYYPKRTTRIHSGYILLTSVVFSWINVFIWSIITVFIGFCR